MELEKVNLFLYVLVHQKQIMEVLIYPQLKILLKSLPKYISSKKYLIIKSTVPIGTCDKLYKVFEKSNMKEYVEEIISNPEFLREGKAIEDCLNPDRVIIGCKKKELKDCNVESIYEFCKRKENCNYGSGKFRVE